MAAIKNRLILEEENDYYSDVGISYDDYVYNGVQENEMGVSGWDSQIQDGRSGFRKSVQKMLQVLSKITMRFKD
jgi:hypothetical protein